jgi:hypothetical protein
MRTSPDEIGFLRGIWMDGFRRLAWLEDYAASLAADADLPVPATVRNGIRLDHVSFVYPGTSSVVLDERIPGLIVVLDGARLVETGSHEVIARGASTRSSTGSRPRRIASAFWHVRVRAALIGAERAMTCRRQRRLAMDVTRKRQ